MYLPCWLARRATRAALADRRPFTHNLRREVTRPLRPTFLALNPSYTAQRVVACPPAQEVLRALAARGISVRMASKRLAAEEAPQSYKVTACCPALSPLLAQAPVQMCMERCLMLGRGLWLQRHGGVLQHLWFALYPAQMLTYCYAATGERFHASPRQALRRMHMWPAPCLLSVPGRGRGGGGLPGGGHQPQGGEAAAGGGGQGLSGTPAWPAAALSFCDK